MPRNRVLGLLPQVYDIPWEFGTGLFLLGLSWLGTKTACVSRFSRGRPVVYLHGTAARAGSLAPMRLYMAARGHGVGYAFEYPTTADFDAVARSLARKLTRVVKRARLDADNPLTLVGHSLGGLIIRRYLQLYPGRHPVGRVNLLSTPNYGSHLAHYFPTEVTTMLLPGSEFLKRLNDGRQLSDGVRYLCIHGDRDLLVLPRESMQLEGCPFLVVPGVGHNSVVLSPAVMAELEEQLASEGAPQVQADVAV